MAGIRAVRDAGGRGDRPGVGTEAEPKRRRSKGKVAGPTPEERNGAEPARREAVAPESRRDGEAPKPRRKAPARRTGGAAGPGASQARGLAGLGRVVGLRRLGLCAALGALWIVGGCGGGVSGDVGQACMTSGREAASRQLCSCVQGVANQTLSPTDQRRVARFFGDPDEAEAVRASDAARDEAFWSRFRNFTDTAEAICG